MDFLRLSRRSGENDLLVLKMFLMKSYDCVATKNGQKHCITPSELRDMSTRSWRTCFPPQNIGNPYQILTKLHWFYIGFGKDFLYLTEKKTSSPTLSGHIS